MSKVTFQTGQDSATFRDKGTEVSSLTRDKGTTGQAINLVKGRTKVIKHCRQVYISFFLFFRVFLYPFVFIKFRFSKRATKFETMSHMIRRLLIKFQIKSEIALNICGIFKMSELYLSTQKSESI